MILVTEARAVSVRAQIPSQLQLTEWIDERQGPSDGAHPRTEYNNNNYYYYIPINRTVTTVAKPTVIASKDSDPDAWKPSHRAHHGPNMRGPI
jgi:hypothetical protein